MKKFFDDPYAFIGFMVGAIYMDIMFILAIKFGFI
jgi:hypothetical protein